MNTQEKIRNIGLFKEKAAEKFKNLGYCVCSGSNDFPQMEISCNGGRELGNLVLYGQFRFERKRDEFTIDRGLVSRLALIIEPQSESPKILYQYDRGRISGKIKEPEKLVQYPIARKMYDDILGVVNIDLLRDSGNTATIGTSDTRPINLDAGKPLADDSGFDLNLDKNETRGKLGESSDSSGSSGDNGFDLSSGDF